MVSTEHEQTGLDRIISSRKEQQKKDSEKFANTLNESLISTDTMFKWFNIRSRIINGKIPIIAKLVFSLRFCFFDFTDFRQCHMFREFENSERK